MRKNSVSSGCVLLLATLRYMKEYFQNVYEGEIWCLCTVTFGPKSPKLNSRSVYCLRLYSIWKSITFWIFIWKSIFGNCKTTNSRPRVKSHRCQKGWHMNNCTSDKQAKKDWRHSTIIYILFVNNYLRVQFLICKKIKLWSFKLGNQSWKLKTYKSITFGKGASFKFPKYVPKRVRYE
jgi:hypothetical protein